MIVAPRTLEQNLYLASFACDILGDNLESFGFDRTGTPMFNTMGFTVGDDLACVVVAYHYVKPNVMMAFASNNPRWCTRTNIKAIGQWAFEDMGCGRITVFISKANKRSRKWNEGMGFQYEGNLKKASPEGDVIIYGLTKEAHQEWLRKAFNGKKHTTSAGT